MIVVIIGCSFEADAVKGPPDIFLGKNDIEEPEKGELLGEIVWEKEKVMCEAEEGDRFANPSKRGEDGRVRPADEDVGVLCRSGSAKEK